jgi:hypothetical protein
MNGIIAYLIVGVAFNFAWDTLINKSGNEENRFTLLERFIATLIWPFYMVYFVFYTIKTFLK